MHAIVYDYEKYFGNDYLKCITLNFNSTELFNFYEILFRLLKYKNGVIVNKNHSQNSQPYKFFFFIKRGTKKN